MALDCGDYDADGVTSTAMMVQALRSQGANVDCYIPNRFDEGYGLNKQAIDEIVERGASLVITVDCGIRSANEVARREAKREWNREYMRKRRSSEEGSS